MTDTSNGYEEENEDRMESGWQKVYFSIPQLFNTLAHFYRSRSKK